MKNLRSFIVLCSFCLISLTSNSLMAQNFMPINDAIINVDKVVTSLEVTYGHIYKTRPYKFNPSMASTPQSEVDIAKIQFGKWILDELKSGNVVSTSIEAAYQKIPEIKRSSYEIIKAKSFYTDLLSI